MKDFLKIKQWRLSLVGLAVFLGLLSALQVFFSIYSDQLVGVVLREIVRIKSEQLYRLSYEELRLNFIGSSLEIKNVELIPDSVYYFDARTQRWQTNNKVYQVSLPEVRVKGVGLWRVFLGGGRLLLKEVTIDRPHVRIYSQEDMKETDESPFEISNLFFLISDRLDFFGIEKFYVQDSRWEIEHTSDKSQEKYDFQNISLKASSFEIDQQTEQENRPFRIADLSIDIAHNAFEVPDFPYRFSFDRLRLSTAGQHGLLEGLYIRSLNEEGYEIKLPSLEIQNIDFQKAYFDQVLQIKQIILQAPQTRIFSLAGLHLPDFTFEGSDGLFQRINQYFKQIHVHQIQLDSSSFSLRSTDAVYPFRFNGITLSLDNFLLDSATYQKRKKHFFLDHFEIIFDDYELQLPDSIHILKAKYLRFSSREGGIQADSLRIFPHPEKQAHAQLDLLFRHLELKDIDTWQAYLEQRLNGGTLRLNGGKIKVFAKSNNKKNKRYVEEIKEFLISKNVNIFFDTIRTQRLSLHVSYPDANQDIFLDKVSLRLHRLQIRQQYLSATYAHLTGDGFSLPDRRQIHRLTGENFILSSGSKILEINTLKLMPIFPMIQLARLDSIPENPIHDLQIKRIALEGFDFLEMLRSQKLRADRLLVVAPAMSVFRHEASKLKIEKNKIWQRLLLENDLLTEIKLSKIELTDGSFSLVHFNRDYGLRQRLGVQEVRLWATDFRIDSLTRDQAYLFFQSDSLRLSLKDYLFYLPDEQHILEAESLVLMSDQGMGHIESLRLRPLRQGKNHSTYQVEIPHLYLKGLNIKKWLFFRELELDTLKIPNPYVSLHFLNTNKDTLSSSFSEKVKLGSLYELVQSSLQKLVVHHALVDSLQFDWRSERAGRLNTFYADRVRLEVDHFLLDKAAKMTNDRILYADDIRVWVACYEQLLPDSTHQLTWHDGYFSSKSKQVQVKNIEVYSRNTDDFYFRSPLLYFRGLRLRDAYTQEALVLDTIIVDTPVWRQYWGKGQRDFSWDSLDRIYDHLKPFFGRYAIAHLLVRQADMDFKFPKEKKINKFFPLQNVTLHMQDFALPMTYPKKLFFSELISLQLPAYVFPLTDTSYQLTSGAIVLRSSDRSVLVRDLHWTPKIPPAAYMSAQAYQTDWVRASMDTLVMTGLDWRYLFTAGGLRVRSASVYGGGIEAFRDKRLPEAIGAYRPMPQQYLDKIPFPFAMDTLHLRGLRVSYSEHPEKGEQSGEIYFDPLDAELYGLSNHPTDSLLSCLIRADLMGEARLHARLYFDLLDSLHGYQLSGTMDSLDMRSLNELLIPLAALRINKGFIKHFHFQITANDSQAEGIMDLNYQKLKVKLLNRKNNTAGVSELLLSVVANALVRNRNPGPLAHKKIGQVKLERDQEKSIFNYWAKIFLDGIKSSIGLPR
ncbi:MAG: hypothetical protein ACFCUI_13705 [Bernardetiaceae bacterium]